MTIKFVLLVNKQGQTRLARYTEEHLSIGERRALEGEIVRKCLQRRENEVRPRAAGAAGPTGEGGGLADLKNIYLVVVQVNRPPLNFPLEIINYFKPRFWFIENPMPR